MGILANENAISGGNYQISNSLRFQSASSQYLSRTPVVAGNGQTWTYSAWVKRGTLGVLQYIISAGVASTGQASIFFDSSDKLNLYTIDSNIVRTNLITTQVFRDPSAWYHVVVVYDETNSTSSDKARLYVNGSRITSFSTATYPPGSAGSYMNSTNPHSIGKIAYTTSNYFDGYLTEINFIDGQALTPSSFGTTDPTSGQWVAAKYTGTYGTNGFYLPFSNGTSTTTLGADSSSNGNNWTLTNFTRSAGVSDCWMYDVPSGNGATIAATQPSSNYGSWNPLDKTSGVTLSQANMNASITTNNRGVSSTVAMPKTGKYYAEVTITASTSNYNGNMLGVVSIDSGWSILANTSNPYLYSYGYFYASNGQKANNGTFSAYGAAYSTNDVIGIALDLDNGTLTFYKNNVSQGTAYTGLSGLTFLIAASNANGVANTWGAELNQGQRSFAYTPPSGFKALCTANLPVATIKQGNKYMDATLYTGNGTSLTVTNAAGFKPDFVWAKSRSNALTHLLFDTVRGASNLLNSNTTNAELFANNTLTAFNSNGFSIGSSTDINTNAATFVGWQWQAGQGTTSSNTNGSITSTVSVNATAGFSVVTYTGTGANATVGHGLGVAPKMVIVKNRSAVSSWRVYHANANASPATGNLYLDATNAFTTDATSWNNTAPTSSVVSLGVSSAGNANGNNHVIYAFAEIAGFSKFGSYTGNGSADGPFVYCGFRPKFVLWKSAGEVSFWNIVDTSRSPDNPSVNYLNPNSSSAEGAANLIDTLSNGFKLRVNSAGNNASGQTYIFMAFAENPFAQANAH